MNKSTYILGAVLVVLLGCYWYFFTGSPEEIPITVSEPLEQSEQQFIDLSSKLNSISFDTSIFDDPRFLSLKSLSIPILPEPQGRTDPFAPLAL